jgi:predicted AlkP superfamily pyrophosphatase or phosphodiesterase
LKIPPTVLLLLATAAWAIQPVAKRPKLVVVLSIDQLSEDLVQRWGGDWTGGLGRLQAAGVVFTRAYHAHGVPKTSPGHAALLSGRHPSRTGIPVNIWMDRVSGGPVESVEDGSTRTFRKEKGRGSGPSHFRGSTLGGWLREQVPGSRSFSVAGKDRAAILLAGAKADGVYWFEDGVGFTTSTAYADRLPAWLERHDEALLDRNRHAAFWWGPAGPVPAGRTITGQWNVEGRLLTGRLPIQVNGAGMPLDPAFWTRWKDSPFWDDATLEAAELLMKVEKLGEGSGTDLLAVGLSSTDYIGHAFGNAGEEMYDQLRRLDARLGTFLQKVWERCPEAWVVLSADHGAEDFAERLAEQGYRAKRLKTKPWVDELRKRLQEKFKVTGDPLRPGSNSVHLYVNDAVLGAVGATRADMLKAVADEARTMPEVVDAVTGPELEAVRIAPETSPEKLTFREQLSLSYVPIRSGDILLVFKPHIVWDGPPKEHPVNHGAPYDYDRRVPLIFLGPWTAERRDEPVRTVDLAATLAAELGIKPGEPIDGRPLPLKPAK